MKSDNNRETKKAGKYEYMDKKVCKRSNAYSIIFL